jgi:muramoyltetrapeptide carboxypeptidase
MEAWRRMGLVSFSGPMIAGTQLTRLDAAGLDVYFSALTSLDPPAPLTGNAVRVVAPGSGEGVLLGGNLTLLCCLAAAGRLLSFTGAVLLIEDTNEPPYRIDRMLTVLRLGGHLDGVAGIAAGEFTGGVTPASLDALLADRLGDLSAPIIAGVDFGHGTRNRLLPLGARARLETSPPRICLLEAGVC